MNFTPNLASLNLIKLEVDMALAHVEAQVSSYVEERENTGLLASAISELDQVSGAFRIVEMPGAIELAQALCQLIRQLQTNGPDASDETFAALGNGVMVLGRYLEYVQLKQKGWPQLLLPAINQIRSALGQGSLPEGHFLTPQIPDHSPVTTPLDMSPVQLKALVKRLRLMFQTGLIAVLRDQADGMHFRMMGRACERARQVCGDRPLALVWWSADLMLEALQQGVALTPARKSLLGYFDRQLKALLENDGNVRLDSRRLADTVYVVGLAAQLPERENLLTTLGVQYQCLSDAEMQAEYELMCGPGGSVIRTVSDVLKEEIAHIKDMLDMMSRAGDHDSDGQTTLSESLNRTAQTLVMLGLLDASQLMREQADAVISWQGEPDAQSLNSLVDALMEIEDAVAALVRRMTPGSDTALNNSRVSVHQLDEARAMLIAESRSGLSLIKRAVGSYLTSGQDLLHLANVPPTLQSVSGGMGFLALPRCAAVLNACAHFVEQRMLQSIKQPSMAEMETLADAVSSVDYYLEGLETNKPTSDSILDIAEDSMKELGFPVSTLKSTS